MKSKFEGWSGDAAVKRIDEENKEAAKERSSKKKKI